MARIDIVSFVHKLLKNIFKMQKSDYTVLTITSVTNPNKSWLFKQNQDW